MQNSGFNLIQKNGGEINETAGDGMMVIFQHSHPNQHARNAVRAASDIQKECKEVSKIAGADLFPIQVNIGISSGEVYLGSTKMRGSNGDRWTFTASGSVTILAARLSEFGRCGQILICKETARRIRDIFSSFMWILSIQFCQNHCKDIDFYQPAPPK